eukprot:2243548-Prymnesium_polylepis.1
MPTVSAPSAAAHRAATQGRRRVLSRRPATRGSPDAGRSAQPPPPRSKRGAATRRAVERGRAGWKACAASDGVPRSAV